MTTSTVLRFWAVFTH